MVRVWFRTSVPGFRFGVLYGNCRAGGGRDQHAWFFDNGRFVGPDPPNSSHDILGIWRDDKTITFLHVLYRQTDPECCPTGGAVVRFRWNGKRAKRLDRLAPRAFRPGVRAGRRPPTGDLACARLSAYSRPRLREKRWAAGPNSHD
jgi:LppP/LprE lipoprotein